MNSTDTINHKTPAFSTRSHSQAKTYLSIVFPLLRHLNTRTLALLMFLAFAFLNTTHGKDAQTTKPVAGATNTEVGGKGRQGALEDAALILWQFTAQFVSALKAELDAPSFGESDGQPGTFAPDLQTTPCQGTERKTANY